MIKGVLVLVATPIGNLGDLSPRARSELEGADVIACEDTRRTGLLLHLVGVAAGGRMVVVNDHTESERAPAILDRLAAGDRVVLVSDAGMPGVSDPGERLVAAAVAAGYVVEVVPGPSAVLAALVASGLPAGRFCFEGFLPRRGSPRAARIGEIARERRTTVLYEAPHRLARTLEDLSVACGSERLVAVARELTKMHEEFFRGTLAEATRWASAGPIGELVIVLGGAGEPAAATEDDAVSAVRAAMAQGLSARDAASSVAERLGLPRRRVYELANRRERS